jgi:hypothetical protein
MRIAIRVFCLILTMIAASGPSRGQTQGSRGLEQSSRDFVQRFYDRLVDASRQGPRAGPGTGFPIDPELNRLLTIDEVEAKAFPGEIAGLDFDPFAGGNDVCTRYEVGRVERRGDRYLVDVHCNWRGDKREQRPHLAVELNDSLGRWTIMNMHYYSYEDGLPPRTTDLVSTLKVVREERKARRAIAPAGGFKASDPESAGLEIGLIDDSGMQFRDGCGCSFWPASGSSGSVGPADGKFYLVENVENRAWMSINGRIVELQLVADTTKFKGRAGDRYQIDYRAGDIEVRVECVATDFGDTHSVSCDATLTVRRGALSQTLRAEGDCGC